MRWLPRSLLSRVFALYALTLVLIAGTGLALFLWQQVQRQVLDTRDDAQALLGMVAPMLTDNAVIGDYDAIRRQLDLLARHSAIDHAEYRDAVGTTLLGTERTTGSVSPRWLQSWVADQLGEPRMRLAAGGRSYGEVRLALSAVSLAGGLWQQSLTALALASGGVLAGLILIRRPLHRWLAPMERIGRLGGELEGARALAQRAMRSDAPLEFHRTFQVLDHAAARLQEQRERAAATLQAIDEAVFTCDAQVRVLLVNESAQRLLGLPASRIVGRPLVDLLPDLATSSDGELQPGARWQHRRLTWVDGSGETHVLDSNLGPVGDAEGAAVGLVLACRDVTDQDRQTRAVHALNAARDAALTSLRRVLEEGAARGAQPLAGPLGDLEAVSLLVSRLVTRLHEHGAQLDAIFSLSPDGFVSFDDQGQVRYASPGFTRLTGLTSEMVTGLEEAVFLHRLRSRCAQPLDAARLEPLFAEQGTDRRVMLAIARPARRFVEFALHSGASGSAGAVARVLHLRDVTRETEVERMKSEFVAAAAHELRTPMVGIYGYSELLVTRQMSPEKARSLLQRIHRQCEVMIDILNEMLDLARLEARQGADFDWARLALDEVVARTLADYCPPPDRQAPIWTSPGSAAANWVRADAAKLQRALRNLLSNAYKYSPAGGDVELRLRLDATGSRCGIEVQDHGIGMTAEQLARVGERFYRADESGAVLGTGLGMSLVREIIALHDGSLQLESTPGEGTRAVLWLPLTDAQAVECEPVEAAETA